MLEALLSFQQRNNQQLELWLSHIPHQNQPLVEAMRYGLLLGGKRARPFLVYITGQMLGCKIEELDTPAS
ncbi:MAG TPA: geranyl transferase, partial [Vibrio sp.]|nr:geranyl transferase [Vibrio sp.]